MPITSRKAFSNPTLKKRMDKNHTQMQSNSAVVSVLYNSIPIQASPAGLVAAGCEVHRTQKKKPCFPHLLCGHCLNNQSYDACIAVTGNNVMNLECLAH